MKGKYGKKLKELYSELQESCNKVLDVIKEIPRALERPIFLELTDKGPGVGVNNRDARIRNAELSILHKSSRRTRVHRARWDSGQGESERTNACVGEAIADGGAMKWDHHKPCAGMSKEQIEAMTIDEYEEEEAKCTEKNAWCVAQEVKDNCP